MVPVRISNIKHNGTTSQWKVWGRKNIDRRNRMRMTEVIRMYQFNFGRMAGNIQRIPSRKSNGQAQMRLRFHFVEGITEMKVVKYRINPANPKTRNTLTSNQSNLRIFFLSRSVKAKTAKKKSSTTTAGEVTEKVLSNGGASKITTGEAVNGDVTPSRTTNFPVKLGTSTPVDGEGTFSLTTTAFERSFPK